MRLPNTRIAVFLSLFLCAASVNAADIQIKMLDTSPTEGMVTFEPVFIKANINDTLVFNPVNPGHNVRSLLVPDGAQPWKSPFNKEFRVTLEKEGIYLYICDAHKKIMSMVGVVQVGNAVNLEEAKKVVAEESASMMMNKDRFAKALEQVQ